jgi:branched-subunit amino acid transport protein AzlD
MVRKLLLLVTVSVLSFTAARAQQLTRFAYIQTDNKQPFYVKWNGKVLSSSVSGYLIISKIKEQQISFVIGFPKNLHPEQSFTIAFTGNKDAGFLLKNFGNKGWGLYNLQSLAVVYAAADAQKPGNKEEIVNTPVINQPKVEETNSPFGNLLVQVTQDSTVKNTTVEKPIEAVVAKKEEPAKPVIDTVKKEIKTDDKPVIAETKKEVAQVIAKPDVVAQVKTDSIQQQPKTEIKEQTVTPVKEEIKPETKQEVKTEPKPETKVPEKVEAVKSTVNLFATNENAEGWDYIYIDEEKTGKKDTITIFIAKEKTEIKPVIKEEPVIKDTVKKETGQPKFIDIFVDTTVRNTTPVIEPVKIDTVSKEPEKEMIKQQDSVIKSPVEPVKTIAEPVKQPLPVKEPSKAVMVNTDCKNMAADKDFINLRKKMAAEESDDDMIASARKIFKTKCFTSEQVKNLCVLFLKDDGKYKFLDAAYPYVYDTDSFKQLVSLLTEEYYIIRFKAMIKN